MENAEAKKVLWGEEFHVVPEGLAEDEVVSFVDDLMEQSRQIRDDQERQASLHRLAEQTVVEADKLAASIKQQARGEAEAEAARLIAAAEQEGRERAQRIVRAAERESATLSTDSAAKGKEEAEQILAQARREAELMIKATKDELPAIESEAKLEAEYLVRRFTVKFVEQIRSAVTETCNDMLPSLDDLMKESSHSGALDEGDSKHAIAPVEKKARSSSRRS